MTDGARNRAFDDLAAATDLPHVRRMTVAVALISEALSERGMNATLVGGGALEFHAPDTYATSDIDLVVEGGDRTDLDSTFTALGFKRRHRHWVRGDVFVEVPGNWMSDPTEACAIGDHTIRVIRKEIVLADRIIGFKHWNVTAYGAQALALMAAVGGNLDEDMLEKKLRAEDAMDAYELLRRLGASGEPVSDERLRVEVDQLRTRFRRREREDDAR
ncbi:MAG: hypothetical protein ACRENI_03785 [Gemmatimonadaceae bacterium]